MSMLQKIKTAIARFRRDERASLSIETVIIFPLLAWCYIGMFTYFDAFRAQSHSDKAAFAIADMVSRETDYITPQYIRSLYELHGLMTRDNNATQMRLTVVRWDDNNDRYTKVWSQRRGGAPSLNNSTLRSAAYRQRMPDGLPHGERLILLETWTVYEPPFDLGRLLDWSWSGNFGAVRFDAFIVTRPRFADQVCFKPSEDPFDLSGRKC